MLNGLVPVWVLLELVLEVGDLGGSQSLSLLLDEVHRLLPLLSLALHH